MTDDCGEDEAVRVDDDREQCPAAGDVGTGQLPNLHAGLQIDDPDEVEPEVVDLDAVMSFGLEAVDVAVIGGRRARG
jgi:hypothetical protein